LVLARKLLFRLPRLFIPIAAALGYHLYVRPKMLKAGTLTGEAQKAMPGDDIIIAPSYSATRSAHIKAAPEVVWAWLAQMGRDGTGYYGLDAFTNNGIPSAAYLRDDLPPLTLDTLLDGGYRVFDVQENTLLLIGGLDLRTPIGEPMEKTVLYFLEKQTDGTTRLFIRVRGYVYGALGPVFSYLYEIFDYFNTTAQLENLKVRGETLAQLNKPVGA
jgi:hypothetical protein